MNKVLFGKTQDGVDIYKYTLKNGDIEVGILNYGGIITEILVPDKNGDISNVVLNYDNVESYEENAPYFGCITGRNAGRIKNGVFKLNNTQYNLAVNNGANHLHGGVVGLNKRVWTVKEFTDKLLTLNYLSPHLEEGYPGEVEFTVTYSIERSTLEISYCGVPDRDTILNLTNHSYFNLSGNHMTNILDHNLKISSDKIAPLDESGAVTSNFLDVECTPFDFRKGNKIGMSIDENHSQLHQGKGYDHPFILNNGNNQPQIVLEYKESGRTLEITTSDKVVVMYSANYLEPNYRCGVCLETQDIPDYINLDNWEKKIYNSNNIYKSKTIYKFEVDTESK